MLDRNCKESGKESFETQLERELNSIECARNELGSLPDKVGSGNPRQAKSPTDDPKLVYQRAYGKDLLGLAFSGGGIRSATFNLGVIQGLAKLRLLHKVDYLSTVSGGGYIGCWLSAWVHRVSRAEDCGHPRSGVLCVEQKLNNPSGGGREPPEVDWLRRFSNYLTPRLGLLSTDTLTGVVTYLRNLILNQTELVLFAAALLLIPWFVSASLGRVLPGNGGGVIPLAVAVSVLLTFASALAGYETRSVLARKGDEHVKDHKDAKVLHRTITGCLALYALTSGWLLGYRADQLPWWGLCLMGVVPYGVGWSLGWRLCSEDSSNKAAEDLSSETVEPESQRRLKSRAAVVTALAAGVLLGLMFSLWRVISISAFGSPEESWRLPVVTLGPVAMLGVILLCMGLQLGLAGRVFRESVRELWSRHGASLLHIALVWLLLAGVALFGPFLVIWLDDWVVGMGGALWVASTLVGVMAATGGSTGGDNSARWAEFAAKLAPYIFVAGALILTSYGLYRLLCLQWVDTTPAEAICEQRPADRGAPLYDLDIVQTKPNAIGGRVYQAETSPNCAIAKYYSLADKIVAGHAVSLILYPCGLIAVLVLLSWRIDINIFSFHMFYRNRLERCYLGASNQKRRKSHPMTGLDPNDSPALKNLVFKIETDGEPATYAQRPFPIINTALNVTRSENLAWQERKAASFTFTPLYCGYQIDGDNPIEAYQSTDSYVKNEGWISLGMPLTISGAAANPNSGYHTSPATAFLMTLFNVRLGWWLQNPRYKEQWKTAGPKRGLWLLLQELAGATTDRSCYVNLSDGGHFENLGIYELVRRRCRFIIACDAGCDADYAFEDLGNAIRKCRIDFGVDIEIDTRAIKPDPESGFSAAHCAIGRIRYDRREESQLGYLLYIKASLTGDEPADVLQYHNALRDFPHQSTADQWFSESQFESYRKLGKHILKQVMDLRKAGDRTSFENVGTEELFRELDEYWYPPSRYVEASFSKHGEALEAIFDTMRGDKEQLGFLDSQIYPEWWRMDQKQAGSKAAPEITMLPDNPDQVRAGFYFCNSLIQLMENVYLDLHLEEEYDYPDNRGWMNLFRHWSWSGMFRVTWAISACTYGARFQHFCRRRLDLYVGTLSCSQALPVDKKNKKGSLERLNFMERKIVEDIIGRESNPADTEIVQLLLQVADLDADAKHGPPALEFPVGFAVMVRKEEARWLLYYRIQDHLRKIGLGRLGLAILKADKSLVGVASVDELESFPYELDYVQLKKLWDSVEDLSRGSLKASYRV